MKNSKRFLGKNLVTDIALGRSCTHKQIDHPIVVVQCDFHVKTVRSELNKNSIETYSYTAHNSRSIIGLGVPWPTRVCLIANTNDSVVRVLLLLATVSKLGQTYLNALRWFSHRRKRTSGLRTEADKPATGSIRRTNISIFTRRQPVRFERFDVIAICYS